MKTLVTGILIVFSTVLHAQIITTIAGNGTPGLSGEGGPAITAAISGGNGIAVDKFGNIYFSDGIGDVIEKIDTNGILTRFAGNSLTGYAGDGGPATDAELELFLDVGIIADNIGNIYFTDGGRVRMVNLAGIITTIAGNPVLFDTSGDGGPATAAAFEAPTGICFDNTGNLYICDDEASNIRKVNTSGIISTFAGTTIGFSGDGGLAINAQMKSPEGIACDDSGNIYFGDLNTSRIRKINTAGVINTIAGGNESVSRLVTCEGCPATSISLYGAIGVAIDNAGNVYASAISDAVVQKITNNGLAYTIAGTGAQGYSGDGGPATDAKLYAPKMICLDNAGNLLITDPGNYRIRKVWLNPTSIPHIQPGSLRFSAYPNPVTNHYLTCTITADTYDVATIAIRDILGQEVFRSRCLTNNATGFTIDVPPGLYFITAYTTSGTIVEKLVVE